MKTKCNRTISGLLLLAGLTGVPGTQAAVSVYGAAASSGEHLTVQVYAHVTEVPIVSFSFKMFYDPALLQVVNATRNEALWYMHDGSRLIPYQVPEASQPGAVRFVGGLLDARNPGAGVLGNGCLLGTVVFRRLGSDTPQFTVALGQPGDYASFVTVNGLTLEARPGEVTFGPVLPNRHDQDLDGLTDAWEIQFFNDIRLAYYADDPDADNVNNQGEEALGSDPGDPASNLTLMVVRRANGVVLQWTSFAERSYTIEASDDLNRFRPIETGVKADPPLNTYELKVEPSAPRAFYRIVLEASAP